MAPFRASRSTRSGRPGGQNDQDVFEGLPVRQWRLKETVFAPLEETNAGTELQNDNRGLWTELPMPKGSNMYQPWCQQLLRAARAGRILSAQKRAWDGSVIGDTDGEDEDEELEKTDANGVGAPRGVKRNTPHTFTAKRWAQLPRHMEEPDAEYLAKRRKGLTTLRSAPVMSSGQMRKTKVRRTDAEGQSQVWEVLVPEGQAVEGEINENVTLESASAPIVTPAPGTVVEGLGVANNEGVVVAHEGAMLPPKRKGPPIPKKKKGPGRGRKKIATTTTEGLGVSASAEDLAASKLLEQQKQGDAAHSGGSTGLIDNNQQQTPNGDDEDEDEDDDESEEEEEDDDEIGKQARGEDREEGELSPTPEGKQVNAEVEEVVVTNTEAATVGSTTIAVESIVPELPSQPVVVEEDDDDGDSSPYEPPDPYPRMETEPSKEAAKEELTISNGVEEAGSSMRSPLSGNEDAEMQEIYTAKEIPANEDVQMLDLLETEKETAEPA